MNSMLQRFVVIGITALLAAACVRLVRKALPHATLRENHEFAGMMYQMLGLVYGVYLAFTIIAVWEQFGDAEKTSTNEATHLSELWRDAQTFPVTSRNLIQTALHTYTRSVVDREWPSMDVRHGPDSVTAESYERLWDAYYAVTPEPGNAQQAMFYAESLHQLNELGMLRRLRILASGSHLPNLMWVLLIVGAVVTVAFMFSFGTKHAVTQYAVTTAVACMLVFSILMVGALEHPFSGDVSIKPDAFEGVIKSMDLRLEGQRTGQASPVRR